MLYVVGITSNGNVNMQFKNLISHSPISVVELIL